VTAEAEYEAPTWNQIFNMLLKQAGRICRSSFKPDIIVGVSRGGWPPARILSDLLENPNLANVKAESYLGIGEARNKPTLTQGVSVNVAGKKVLIVDEVADTGGSLKLVREHVLEQGASEVKVATLYYKPCSEFKPDYYEKETDRWIVFPWETKETLRKIFETHNTNAARLRKETAKLASAGVPKRLITRFLKEFNEAKAC
jgi:hypoxanthine phosphoribosyltransferase